MLFLLIHSLLCGGNFPGRSAVYLRDYDSRIMVSNKVGFYTTLENEIAFDLQSLYINMHFSLVFHMELGRPGLYILHYFLRSLLNYMFYTNHSDWVDIRCKQWERISRRLWVFWDINSSIKGPGTLVWHASQGVFLSNGLISRNNINDTRSELLGF